MTAESSGALEAAIAKLKVGDMIMMRYHHGFIYRSIREVTDSYWNHIALVFDVIEDAHGHRTVLVVEAGPNGIEIHRLQRYVNDPDEYAIGFKRMPLLDDASRQRFLGFFLDVLDTPYDYTRLVGFLFRETLLRLGGTKAEDYVARRVVNAGNFICSSFAQRAYYLAVPEGLRDKTFFKNDAASLDFLHRMEYITPGDIAKSKNTEWLYNPHD